MRFFNIVTLENKNINDKDYKKGESRAKILRIH